MLLTDEYRCVILTIDAPSIAVARDLATAAVGCPPTAVRRFRTGGHHYVFEATFATRPPVVVRIAAEHSRSAMAGALKLSHLLRPQGVPLPKIIADGVNHRFSHLVLERLPGVDLGAAIRELSDSSLEIIARQVAQAQRITAKASSGRRYGYGVGPEDAPHNRWSGVLQDNLARSRKRIAAARLFSEDPVNAVTELVSLAHHELDSLAPIPFLHDTTTKNVIVTPAGSFSGIVDVDDLCFGDPRYVIALTLASLLASGGPTHYIDAWLNAAGYEKDRLFELYVVLFLVDFMSEHGRTFNRNPLPAAAADRSRLLSIFADRLQHLE